MRFFHIADVHLGAEPDKGYPWSEDRGREIWDSFRNVIRQAGRENAGLFLIAGDLFHRQPLMKELKEVNYLFSTIPETRVIIIAGNHDYMRSDSAYRKIKWAENVFWLDGAALSHVDFPEIGISVYGLSYHDREIREPLYDKLEPDYKMPVNILLAHGGDEKHIPFTKEAFEAFDYAALGHIHKPQILLENQAAYAGALEPIDKNDTGIHGYIKGDIKKQQVKIAFVPCAVREYKSIKVNINEKTTQFSLEKTLKIAMEERGIHNLYNIILEGKKSLETEFLEDRLYELGNVRDIEDRTIPAYSVEKLKMKYEGSILGEFISKFKDSGRSLDEEKALHYGIEALLASGGGIAMIINELILKNFGKFQNKKIELKEGINVIYGGNESGKTTIHSFLQGIFFGIRRMRGRASKTDNYTRYTPWENPGWYEGSIVFTCGNKRFRLERNFGKPAEEAVLFCETDGELLSVSNGDLDMLLGNISESVYRNTVSAGQMKSRTEEGLLAELRDYMANFQGFGDLNLNPEKALVILKDKKKEWEKKEQKELFDRQKLEEELQYRIQYETEEIENLEEKIGELEKEKQELEKGEESGYKETGSERKAGISFSRLILYVFFVVSGCLGVVFLRFSWIIPLVFLLFAVLAEIFISRKSDWSEQEIPKFSMDRRGKIKEQKNVLQTSLEERKVRLYNLKEELQEVCADNEKITEIRKEIRAIVTAASLIKEVSGKMQGSAGKILKDKMSEILSEMTCGKYCRVVLDEDFNISLDTGSRCLELHQVSHGTVEQVYLALRMACGEILCQEEELPVILDETFAMYDDNRLLQTLYWMSRRKSQVILFSCNKREIEALERGKISYHLIRLM